MDEAHSGIDLSLANQHLDVSGSSRNLIRMLRTRPQNGDSPDGELPESIAWNIFCELKRRGETRADEVFLQSVRSLHRRRCLAVTALPSADHHPEEHKLVSDPMLGELWRAYKRCICSQRTGPAGQLLRDIEAQLLQN